MIETTFMKKTTILLSAIVVATIGAATFQSCNKLASLVQYDLPMQTASAEVVLPPSTDTVGSASGSQVVNYNIDSFIKANTANVLGISNITSAKITSCKITIENPTVVNNFANFRTATGSVFSNSNATPYTISVNNGDTYATVLNLPVDSTAELKSYLTGSQFTYSAGGSLRRATTDSIRCKVEFAFKIHVQG